ncbi:MAG: VWA domain-containing protein [Labilithrix sp.]|nr:VWA domain-containing protein [Labilithrix sp.]
MRLVTLRSLGIVTGLLVAVGCGAGSRAGYDEQEQTADPATPGDDGNGGLGGDFGGDVTGDVELDPKNTTIIIDSATDPVTRATVTYKVTSLGKDASSTAKLELADPALGSFAGPAFLSADAIPGDKLGVSTTVKATTPDGQALGRLTLVKLRKTGAQRDFFFIVPYQQAPSPTSDVLEFGTNIKQVDVAFAMDTTGSMQGSINNLKNALSGTLLSQLQAAIPNVGLAIADYRDYPVSPYGSTASAGIPFLGIPATPADWPVKIHQKITTTLATAQTAVGKYTANGGGDNPESQIPAMQHILTGEALSWSGGSVPAATPSPGHFGAVDFRPGSVPVVVNITDVTWHSETNAPYNFATPTMASLKTAFNANNAFFVNVTSGDEGQANELSDATSSNVPASAFSGTCGAGQCCTGTNGAARAAAGPGGSCRLNFLHNNGSGVSDGVVKAIQAISVGASYDVKAVLSNDPKNANGVDATKFVQALRAMEEGNAAAGCEARAARDSDGDGVKDTFVNVVVGTKVCFEVIPAKNTTVPPSNEPQFFNAFVDVVGVQGNVQLDKRSVLFLVPPKDPGVN